MLRGLRLVIFVVAGESVCPLDQLDKPFELGRAAILSAGSLELGMECDMAPVPVFLVVAAQRHAVGYVVSQFRVVTFAKQVVGLQLLAAATNATAPISPADGHGPFAQ